MLIVNIGICDNVKKVLATIAESGVKELVVQPTYLMKGLHYQELQKDIASYSNTFENIVVGEPLLSSEQDFRKVISTITEKTAEYDDGKTAICLVGHGTEANANQVYAKMQKMLGESGYSNYYIGTIKAMPTVTDVLETIQNKAYQRVILQPLMIAVGNHTYHDIAGEKEGSWKNVFKQAGYEVECELVGLSDLEAVQLIFREHAQAAVERCKRGLK